MSAHAASYFRLNIPNSLFKYVPNSLFRSKLHYPRMWTGLSCRIRIRPWVRVRATPGSGFLTAFVYVCDSQWLSRNYVNISQGEGGISHLLTTVKKFALRSVNKGGVEGSTIA